MTKIRKIKEKISSIKNKTLKSVKKFKNSDFAQNVGQKIDENVSKAKSSKILRNIKDFILVRTSEEDDVIDLTPTKKGDKTTDEYGIEKDVEKNEQKINEAKSEFKMADFEDVKQFFRDLKKFLFATSAEEAGYRIKSESTLKKQVRPAVIFALISIGATIFIFMIWGALAPLDSASIANGFIIPSSKPKIIQHLEGGIIKEITVEEGDHVKVGQTLMVLDPTNFKADATSSLSNIRIHLVNERRLIAESLGEKKIDFTSEYLDPNDKEVQLLIKNQEELFASKNATIQAIVDTYKKKIEGLKAEIVGYERRLKSLNDQLVTTEQQLEHTKVLYKKKLVTESDMAMIQNRSYELEGHIAEITSRINSTNENISATEAEMLSRIEDNKMKIQDEYKENHRRLLEYIEHYQKTQHQFDRTVIKSPVDGIVTHITFHTVGGIIPPSSNRIMDIVPENDELIAEVEIRPQDIDHVKVGMEAKVQLTPYKQRLVPRIGGKVIYVSADKIDRQATQQQSLTGEPVQMGGPYYVARIKLDHAEIERLNAEVKLQAGMPVTAFIVEGERSFLYYMMSPIIDSFHKAFKEA